MADAAATHDELIARIARGDREAFALLYRQCRPDVYRFAVHMCGSASLAEDVVQEVFLAVIADASRYRPDRSGVLPWLLGIARNQIRRSRHRRPVLPLPADESDDGRRLAIERDPIADLTGQRRQAALARALHDLPRRYREAIVLCDLQELSYETAAAVLGCAIGTVRSRLHRGRTWLARALGGMEQDTCHERTTGNVAQRRALEARR
jgi:RNA polymerase sigma-70 factor, ECF subfamily